MRQRARGLATHPGQRLKLTAPLYRPYWRMRFHSFGARSVCHRPFWLEGSPKIAVGEGTSLLAPWLAVVGDAWRDPDPEPRLRIGNGVVMLAYSRIIVFESVVIEDHVTIACGCLVTDAEHTRGGSWDSFTQGPLETAPTRVGRGTLLGERVTVLKGSNIGESCFIGANSLVAGEIPDYSVAVGSPARVIGRTRETGD